MERRERIKVKNIMNEKTFWDWFKEITKDAVSFKIKYDKGFISLVTVEKAIKEIDESAFSQTGYGEIDGDKLGWYVEKKYKPVKVISEDGSEKIECITAENNG